VGIVRGWEEKQTGYGEFGEIWCVGFGVGRLGSRLMFCVPRKRYENEGNNDHYLTTFSFYATVLICFGDVPVEFV
jgi:hypothetical protein